MGKLIIKSDIYFLLFAHFPAISLCVFFCLLLSKQTHQHQLPKCRNRISTEAPTHNDAQTKTLRWITYTCNWWTRKQHHHQQQKIAFDTRVCYCNRNVYFFGWVAFVSFFSLIFDFSFRLKLFINSIRNEYVCDYGEEAENRTKNVHIERTASSLFLLLPELHWILLTLSKTLVYLLAIQFCWFSRWYFIVPLNSNCTQMHAAQTHDEH